MDSFGALLFGFLFLNTADVATTVLGLRLGASEENVGIQKLIDKYGKRWPLVKFGLAWVLAIAIYLASLYFDAPQWIWIVMLIVVNAAYFYVVFINNLRVIRRRS